MKVRIYALSTCVYCKKTKEFMKKNGVDFECIDVDLLEGGEKEKVKEEVRKLCRGCGYPVICVGDEVTSGYDEEKLKKMICK